MRFSALIFDVDGTLVDSRESVLNAMDTVRRRFCGRPATAFELERAMTVTNDESFSDFPDEQLPELNAAVEREYRAKPSALFEGAAELVVQARGAGLTLCILTSRFERELLSEKCLAPLLPCFSHIMHAGSGFPVKPSPAPALELLRLCGGQSGKTLYIGDSDTDRLCAAAAGLPFALAGWGAVKDMQAQFRPRGIPELTDIIFGV